MTEAARIGDLPLKLGGTLRDARLAYVAYGKLAPGGRNAVLLTHGYTSTHRFAEGGPSATEGAWNELVGPGAPIDTDRFFVVASNMLGSSHGSTGPGSINPATGKPYGPDFPPVTLADMVATQHRLLETLGVRELVAVAGPSYGGFQAFAWGVERPGFARGLVAAVTGPRSPSAMNLDALRRDFAADPGWNDGWHYETGGIPDTMIALRERTLRGYGIEAKLAERFPDPAARDAEIRRIAREWAEVFDPHSMLVLGEAARRFDATPGFGRIRAKLLYVLSTSDALFPPSLAAEVMPALKAAGVDARYVEIESEHGHLASGVDAAKWAPALRAFIEELI